MKIKPYFLISPQKGCVSLSNEIIATVTLFNQITVTSYCQDNYAPILYLRPQVWGVNISSHFNT